MKAQMKQTSIFNDLRTQNSNIKNTSTVQNKCTMPEAASWLSIFANQAAKRGRKKTDIIVILLSWMTEIAICPPLQYVVISL